jgi:hypothetical protein
LEKFQDRSPVTNQALKSDKSLGPGILVKPLSQFLQEFFEAWLIKDSAGFSPEGDSL